MKSLRFSDSQQISVWMCCIVNIDVPFTEPNSDREKRLPQESNMEKLSFAKSREMCSGSSRQRRLQSQLNAAAPSTRQKQWRIRWSGCHYAADLQTQTRGDLSLWCWKINSQTKWGMISEEKTIDRRIFLLPPGGASSMNGVLFWLKLRGQPSFKVAALLWALWIL